jgi:hypothetical protein
MQVIVSQMKVDDGDVKWNCALDFTYSEAPMLINFMQKSEKGYHSLASKVSSGGFNIARLKIDKND